MITASILEWESTLAETRLTNNHRRDLSRVTRIRRKQGNWKAESGRLREEIAKWRYHKSISPPEIETAWIIHSHLAWRGEESDRDALWDDLPETDPARILEVEAEGPDTASQMPPETLLLLKNVIGELARFGMDIRGERFSENWTLPSSAPKTRASIRRSGETWNLLKGEKASTQKKVKWAFARKSVLGDKATGRSRLLTDFFELRPG